MAQPTTAETAAPTKPHNTTLTNAIDDPTVTLQRFDLTDLEQFAQEKTYATTASKDFHLFYVGAITSTISSNTCCRGSASRCTWTCSEFDDNELNDVLMKIVLDSSITMLVTLDRSQAG